MLPYILCCFPFLYASLGQCLLLAPSDLGHTICQCFFQVFPLLTFFVTALDLSVSRSICKCIQLFFLSEFGASQHYFKAINAMCTPVKISTMEMVASDVCEIYLHAGVFKCFLSIYRLFVWFYLLHALHLRLNVNQTTSNNIMFVSLNTEASTLYVRVGNGWCWCLLANIKVKSNL